MTNGFTECNNNGFIYKTASSISDCGVRHLFTTRAGGVSENEFATMNLGFGRGDSDQNVLANYAVTGRVTGLTVERYVATKQVHGDVIRVISEEDAGTGFTKPPFDGCDGLITDCKGIVLCIYTADCLPILLCDRNKKAVGAVHSGWRGTAANIGGKAVAMMNEMYGCKPENILCAIGPSIGKCCFEVSEDVAGIFGGLPFFHGDIAKKGEKYYIDLWETAAQGLIHSGIPDENITVSGECTCCSWQTYFSHRRTQGKRGTSAAMITL